MIDCDSGFNKRVWEEVKKELDSDLKSEKEWECNEDYNGGTEGKTKIRRPPH